MGFSPAFREQVKLRLALMGLSGTGKTMSALSLAFVISYLARKHGNGPGRIAVVDTERESAKLYAMSRIERARYESMGIDEGYAYGMQIRKFPIDVDLLTSFSPLAYVDKLDLAAREGYDITVLDSISHAWAGTGGALDRKGKAEDRGENSFAAWRKITPEHNAFVDAMLGTPSHLIATLRMKAAHAMETGADGKMKIVDLGTEEVQREGVRYEFTMVGQIDQDHVMTVVKTRLDGVIANGERFERPGDTLGRKIYGWVNDGDQPAEVIEDPIFAKIRSAESEESIKLLIGEIAEFANRHPSRAAEIKSRYAERKASILKREAKPL